MIATPQRQQMIAKIEACWHSVLAGLRRDFRSIIIVCGGCIASLVSWLSGSFLYSVTGPAYAQTSNSPAVAGANATERASNLAENGHCTEVLPLLKKTIRQVTNKDLQNVWDSTACGPRTKVDWIEIKWPLPSGRVERFRDLPIDRYVTIVEGQGKWK